MKENSKPVSSKWKKEYTVVLVANIIYIIMFYILMKIYS